MKEGRIQQIGRPQAVYDVPRNLFVAKFLGTPPVNVFRGRILGGSLLIGDEAVLPAPGLPEGDVTVGIRPEGFLPDPAGAFSLALSRVEVMGRDTSVIADHPASESGAVRAVISSESVPDAGSGTVRFTLKKNKVLLFSPEGEEERIPFGEDGKEGEV